MAEAFYPFVEEDGDATDREGAETAVRFAARIAVYDDAAAAPRVVMVEPTDVRSYLEEITATTTRLAAEQGGRIPFMVIREIVENLIHAYFAEPIVSILDGGNTIRFADQGPGIADKARALEYGTSSATDEMKRYIRGVGSGLPYVQQYLLDKGGSLEIDDNLSRGTVVTISLAAEDGAALEPTAEAAQGPAAYQQGTPQAWPGTAQPYAAAPPLGQPQPYAMPMTSQPYPYAGHMPQLAPWGQVQAPWPAQLAYPQQPAIGAGIPATAAAPFAPPASPLSERGQLVLSYLARHESVGPTELAATYGSSQSTWTRELKALEELGLVAKRGGQKRFLTPAGRAAVGR